MFKYAKLDNMSVVYACFVVRSHFLSEATNLAYSGVMLARASLCEILAMKLLGRFSANSLQLAATLTASWNPLAGAPTDVILDVREAAQFFHIEIDRLLFFDLAIPSNPACEDRRWYAVISEAKLFPESLVEFGLVSGIGLPAGRLVTLLVILVAPSARVMAGLSSVPDSASV